MKILLSVLYNAKFPSCESTKQMEKLIKYNIFQLEKHFSKATLKDILIKNITHHCTSEYLMHKKQI